MSKERKPFTRVDMPREIDRSIADHEVMMSFKHDTDAFAFDEWWHLEGRYAFNEWLEK